MSWTNLGHWVTWLTLAVASAGTFITGLVAMIHVKGLSVPCGAGSFNCEEVLHDARATFAGVPIAAIGFGAWVILLVVSARRVVRIATAFEYWTGYALSGAGTIISVLLAFDSYYRIQAFCLLCLASGMLMSASLICYAVSNRVHTKSPSNAKRIEWGGHHPFTSSVRRCGSCGRKSRPRLLCANRRES